MAIARSVSLDATLERCNGINVNVKSSRKKPKEASRRFPGFGKYLLDLACNSFRNWQSRCRERKWMNNRAPPGESYEPTNVEHFANTVSHGVMVIPSILAGELLLHCTHNQYYSVSKNSNTSIYVELDNPSHLHYEVSARVYGSCLVGLFLVSAIFHWLTWSKCDHPTKTIRLSDNCCGSALWEFFHLCDRAIIFTFIAGSYTPWLMLCSIHPNLSWLRWGIWFFVLIGVVYSFFLLEKYKLIELLLYIAQGLLPALALSTTTESEAIHSLSYGGFFYLLGVFIFKSDGSIPCAHAIWHVFVVAGAVAHFCSCYFYLYNVS